MTHKDVYKLFSNLFPSFSYSGVEYFPNGKNSIRIRGISKFPYINPKQDIVFSCTYNGKDWKLETIDHFIKSMKEGVKNA